MLARPAASCSSVRGMSRSYQAYRVRWAWTIALHNHLLCYTLHTRQMTKSTVWNLTMLSSNIHLYRGVPLGPARTSLHIPVCQIPPASSHTIHPTGASRGGWASMWRGRDMCGTCTFVGGSRYREVICMSGSTAVQICCITTIIYCTTVEITTPHRERCKLCRQGLCCVCRGRGCCGEYSNQKHSGYKEHSGYNDHCAYTTA